VAGVRVWGTDQADAGACQQRGVMPSGMLRHPLFLDWS